MRKLVIIPTYNEKENISAMIDKVFSLPETFEMLVIDDGSPDGTAAIVKERQQEFPATLHLLERSGKQGLGTAYLTGFRWGLDNGFDYICEMDCDFSHNPDDLLRLYQAAAEGNDVVVGSRYVQGVNVVNWPMSRLLMSYFASMYVRIVTRMPLRDATAGFLSSSRHALETQTQGGVDHLRRTPRGHLENERRHLPRSILRRTGTSVSFDQEHEKPVTAIRQEYGRQPPGRLAFMHTYFTAESEHPGNQNVKK